MTILPYLSLTRMHMPAIQFMKKCNLAIEMFEGKAKECSYNMQDKYRLSVFFALNVLNNLEAVVCLSIFMSTLFTYT